MSIEGIPKAKGSPAPPEQRAAAPHAKATGRTSETAQAMEKPPALSQPDAATTHPVRQAPAKPSLHDRELTQLRAALHSSRDNAAAGRQALAAAAGYRMRRSRGARRQALDLCTEVAAEVEELAELARALHTVLTAEGDLQDVSAEATLRACRALAEILESEAS